MGLKDILSSDKNPMSLEKNDIEDILTGNGDVPTKKTFANRDELESELLSLQQQKYLTDQYKKIVNDTYQKSVYYESNRQSAYIDYEQMEYFPEISTALDILSEEATTLFEDGKMLKIESSSSRIKKILGHLFENVLQINTSLPYWARTTCKYGDSFVFLRSEEGKGITKVVQLKNLEIHRKEGNVITGDDTPTFTWDGHNESFNEWQIAHFRLITDDKKLPYGTSVLDKVRKTFKMLSLAEDAMMVYRISRAPERRVFKIDVGNMNADDIDSYVSKVSNNLKRTAKINSTNGQIDYRYNTLTQDEDFFIPVRNGMNQTVIDTLPGAQNLSDIGDIEFLQNKLFSGLKIPKSFLGFEETAGDGKTLSMQDIRFARTINKIQQCMLMELNKIAIIHLYLLGFADDLDNFKLSLANPSKQAKILENEILSGKLDNFVKAVTKIDNGFAPMSFTEASKIILGKSDDEIKLTLQQQFMEAFEARHISEDALASKNLSTGLFDTLEKMYLVRNEDKDEDKKSDDGNGDESGSDFGGGGSFGGGNFGGDDNFDFDGDDNNDLPDSDDDDASDPIDNLQERNTLLHEKFEKLRKEMSEFTNI